MAGARRRRGLFREDAAVWRAWDGSDRDVGGRASAGLPYFWLAAGRGGGSWRWQLAGHAKMLVSLRAKDENAVESLGSPVCRFAPPRIKYRLFSP
jgi:hypothetical protein